MSTFSKKHISGSSGGSPIKVTATSSPGTNIHSTLTSSTAIDEVWLYATNTSVSSITLTLQWGNTANPDDHIVAVIPPLSTVTLIPGHTLSGTGSAARSVAAFAGATNVINIFGYVNRIS